MKTTVNNVCVKWVDAYHIPNDKLTVKKAEKLYDYITFTCGFLMLKNKRFVVLAKNYDTIKKTFSNIDVIPTPSILEIIGETP